MAPTLLRAAQWKRLPLSLTLAVLSIATLPAAWYWWSVERLSAQNLQQTSQRESVMAPLEGQVSQHLAGWKSAQANVASVQEKIKSLGESPDQWSHRSITIENQRMSRTDVEVYLRDLVTNDRNLLVPSTINIRVAKPDDSVFVVHQGLDSADALIVTIKADLYTRGAS
jgi:hypothetical protein